MQRRLFSSPKFRIHSHGSSNVNEVIREILNFLIYFCYERISHAQNAYKRTKIKKAAFYALKEHLRGKKALIRLFAFLGFLWAFCTFCAFCAFAWLRLCTFCIFCVFCVFCACKIFS